MKQRLLESLGDPIKEAQRVIACVRSVARAAVGGCGCGGIGRCRTCEARGKLEDGGVRMKAALVRMPHVPPLRAVHDLGKGRGNRTWCRSRLMCARRISRRLVGAQRITEERAHMRQRRFGLVCWAVGEATSTQRREQQRSLPARSIPPHVGRLHHKPFRRVRQRCGAEEGVEEVCVQDGAVRAAHGHAAPIKDQPRSVRAIGE